MKKYFNLQSFIAETKKNILVLLIFFLYIVKSKKTVIMKYHQKNLSKKKLYKINLQSVA